MEFQINKIRHPKETRYGTLLLVYGCLLWTILALICISTFFYGNLANKITIVFYILVFFLVTYISRALMQAYMFGHYVLIGPNQFPHLHKIVQEGAKQVGLKEAPQAFIYNSHGVMNAMAVRLIGRKRYIWLTSAIIDADNDEQIRFVIGHELGHHVAGHLDGIKHYLRLPGYIIPFLGKAYSRNRELTCDRVGAFVAQNLSASRSALQMLACGSAKLNDQMNPTAFQKQESLVPNVAGYILHIFSFYPRLTKRVEAVSTWYDTFHK
ncbi:M48 family metallopeptidase [Commensalibacter oyaizuii]|uniref:M48 family metallopeptidase n=1 Tax=Commensalibacter oyaizuii TaxID=3043873 RepID=A0ABT6PZ21_9PROT|nr:M48 family metallopeptidase [Commensalibacter sp. TBRC 16381]MDI2090107.1 M48 family metallopeptidase [Commensalibacter sp. TBRC 16381]